MSEQNKAVVRRVVSELWNQHRVEAVDELYAEDYADRSPGLPPGVSPDREGQKQFVRAFFAAFPDLEGTSDEEIAEGDRVVLRWSARGTHRGDFFGIPATGKGVTFTGTSTYRIAGGKIAEEWTHADLLGLMTQIGAVPEPAAGTTA